jgi:hypothetical protein
MRPLRASDARLVVEDELVARQRAPQVRSEGEAPRHLLVHRGGEEAIAAARLLLRRYHGHVGVLHQAVASMPSAGYRLMPMLADEANSRPSIRTVP